MAEPQGETGGRQGAKSRSEPGPAAVAHSDGTLASAKWRVGRAMEAARGLVATLGPVWLAALVLLRAAGAVALDALIAATVALFPVLSYWRVLTSNVDDMAHFVLGDFFELHYPYRRFVADELASGRLPVWNPYVSAGHPALGDIQTATLYPIGWLFASIGGAGMTASLLEAQVIAHLALAAIFSYFFGRRVLSSRLGAAVLAVVFSCGGYLNSFPLQQMIILQVSIWLPLVLLFLDMAICWRSPALAIPAGMALAMAALAGHPQTWFYVLVGTAAYFVYRCLERGPHPAQLAIAAVVGGVGFGLAAPQLLPAYEQLKLTDRAEVGYPFTRYGFSFREMVGFLMPSRYGGRALYIGILTLALAAIGLADRRRPGAKWFWLGVSVVALFWSFGGNTIVQSLPHLAIPLLRLRDHERLSFLVNFAGAVLAGYGADALVARSYSVDVVRRSLRWLAWAAGGIAALAALFLYGAIAAIPEVRGEFDSLADRTLLALLFVAFSFALLAYRVRSGRAAPGWQAVVVLFLAFDLTTAGWKTATADGDPSKLYPSNLVVARIQTQAPGLYRIYSEGLLAGDGNAGSVYRLQDIVGNSPIELEAYKRFTREVPEVQRWRLLSVRFVLTKRDMSSDGRFQLSAKDGDIGAYELKPEFRLPRAWVVRVFAFAATADDELRLTSSIDPARVAVISDEALRLSAARPDATSPTSDSVEVLEYLPNRIVLRAALSEPGLLVVSEIYHSDWHATVDGAETSVYRVDGVLRGVPLEAGLHEVVFWFESAAFARGLGLARDVTTAALWVVAAEAGLRALWRAGRLALRRWRPGRTQAIRS